MPILTKPGTVVKGNENSFSIDKSELLLHSKVVADPYFSNSANWKRITVNFVSLAGAQTETVVFDATIATPVGSFKVSTTARDEFIVASMVIHDFDGGSLSLERTDLLVSEFDVSLGGVTEVVVLTRNFITENSFNAVNGESGYGDETFGINGVTIPTNGGFDLGSIDELAPSILKDTVYKIRFHIAAHTGSFEFDYYGDSPDVLSTNFTSVQLAAAVGSYVDGTVSLRAGVDSYIGIYDNAGNAGSVTISKIELIEMSQASAPEFFSGSPTLFIGTSQANDSLVLSWTAPTYVSDVLSYQIRRNGVGGYSLIGTTSNTTFHDTEINTDGESIQYQITATAPARNGFKAQSNTLSTTHIFDSIAPAVPAAPANFAGNTTGGTVNLSWDAVTDATEYKVYRNSSYWGSVYSPSVTYQENLVDAGTYNYSVSAVVAGVEGNQTSPLVLVVAGTVFNLVRDFGSQGLTPDEIGDSTAVTIQGGDLVFGATGHEYVMINMNAVASVPLVNGNNYVLRLVDITADNASLSINSTVGDDSSQLGGFSLSNGMLEFTFTYNTAHTNPNLLRLGVDIISGAVTLGGFDIRPA